MKMADQIVIQLLQRCISQNDQILAEHEKFRETLSLHASREESLVRSLANAFPKKPDGTPDFEGHEIFHSTLIDESRARTVFYRELQHELIKKGLWGLVLILVALVSYWWSGQLRTPR